MNQPNILVVVADQLSAAALPAFGHDFAVTPNIDRLAARGVHFRHAYTPCPLCRPARASFWTGRLPHQTSVLSNGVQFEETPIPDTMPTLGALLSDAGYRCVHFGKTHDHGALRGFEVFPHASEVLDETPGAFSYNNDTWQDVGTESQAITWLENEDGPPPWCCVVDLNNPHNICGYVANNSDEQMDGALPPLPDNFTTDDMASRPPPIQYLCCTHRRQMQAAHWNERQWRQYRAAYRHFIEDFDARLGRLLDALDARTDVEDTLILFWADHGDGMGAHRLATKHTAFYEEIVNVPLIAAGAGVTGTGPAPGDPLVSLVDLLPTICELAGATTPPDLPGRSFAAALRGSPPPHARQAVVSQWHTEWGTTIEPGRMVRTHRWKYTIYREQDAEELYDLEQDPGETRNLAADPGHADALAEMRQRFTAYCAETDDPFTTLAWKADARWRSHPVGYHHHEGSCAPIEAGACR